MLAVVVVLVAMDVVSTWLSLTRNQDDFYSEIYFSVRKRYLETLLASATGAPPPPTRRQQRKQEKAAHLADLEAERIAASLPPPAPSFSVLDVRRTPKIEDTHGDESDDDSDIEDFKGGNVGSTNLVGMQIYEPARVIARLNRSRTSSAASFRSVPSLAGISDLPGPPQIGVLATGRRSASPFGGGRASPYSNRSPSVPRGRESDPEVSLYHETHEALANMFSGPVPRRMTPTRETLQRYTAERQSLQSLRSIQSMQSLQSHQSLQALPFRSTPVHYPAVAE
ncbi:hypothetical protein SBRCBS47491_003650 [Sporothrix bragantina]|uniref:Transmembrane protein n=1 Tax=Sporothrix bragantina TaxID=671064 RepID=A0ABP0BH74_9PEZI